MLPREGWNFDDLNQSAHPCLSAKNEDSSKAENRSCKEHHGQCLRQYKKKKKNFVGEKASRSAYDQLYRLRRGYHARMICTDSHC